MPNMKVENYRVSGTVNDKRVKLTQSDKIEIVKLHTEGIAIRQLSRDFNVSRRTIQFILFPERLEAVKQHRTDIGGSMHYYDKDKQRVYMKTHRDHKKALVSAPSDLFEIKETEK